MAGTTAGEPLDATAEPTVARASCAMVVRLPPNARGRPVRSDRVRFGGKHCGATAIRVSAGSFRSLTSLTRNARCDAAGWSNPIERILSRRIVRLDAGPTNPHTSLHLSGGLRVQRQIASTDTEAPTSRSEPSIWPCCLNSEAFVLIWGTQCPNRNNPLSIPFFPLWFTFIYVVARLVFCQLFKCWRENRIPVKCPNPLLLAGNLVSANSIETRSR